MTQCQFEVCLWHIAINGCPTLLWCHAFLVTNISYYDQKKKKKILLWHMSLSQHSCASSTNGVVSWVIRHHIQIKGKVINLI